MKRYRDANGDIKYTCYKCKEIFNFKAMYYIEDGTGNCPNCGAVVKLQDEIAKPLSKI